MRRAGSRTSPLRMDSVTTMKRSWTASLRSCEPSWRHKCSLMPVVKTSYRSAMADWSPARTRDFGAPAAEGWRVSYELRGGRQRAKKVAEDDGSNCRTTREIHGSAEYAAETGGFQHCQCRHARLSHARHRLSGGVSERDGG